MDNLFDLKQKRFQLTEWSLLSVTFTLTMTLDFQGEILKIILPRNPLTYYFGA